MNIEKMREEFEAFIKLRNAEDQCFWEGRGGLFGIVDGKYFVSWLQNDWQLWQASRAAIEVELPKMIEAYGGNGHHAGDPDDAYLASDIVAAIEAAGLKVR
jgi:hypothetical protein